jgi:lipoate-protein ligase A
LVVDNRKWRLLQVEYADAARNLATEEAVFESVAEGIAPPTVRLWRNPKTVVIGRFQDPRFEIDFEACSRHNVAVVRRFTGGGAVFQDLDNLNWSFFMPKPFARIDIPETYRKCGMAIVEGLSLLGANANYEPPNMIQINGMKLSGLSMCVRKEAVLCHGTLLISTDLDLLREVLRQTTVVPEHLSRPGCRGYIRSKVRPVTNLTTVLGNSVSLSEVKQALVKGIEEVYEVRLVNQNLFLEEQEKARRLLLWHSDILTVHMT